MNFADEYANRKQAAEKALLKFADTLDGYPNVLREAVLYSLQSGGKRLRPVLFLESVAMFGDANCAATESFAVAVECIHTYSLIHDDLPCMDNDDFRRGKPTSHKKFGEANALLAGDALLNAAYECVLRGIYEGKEEKYVRAGRILARSAGGNGMVGGQVYDLMPMQKAERIDDIYEKKTGALITAALCAGACIGGATDEQAERIRRFGDLFGYAFQLCDDLLDAQSEGAEKNTHIHAYGIRRTKQLLREKTDAALRILADLPNSGFLSDLTVNFMTRTE